MDQTNLFQKAQDAYNDHQYEEALKIGEMLYQNQSKFATNYLLFSVYKKQKAWEKALQIANEFLKKYIENDEYFNEYLDVMLYSGEILDAFRLYYQLKPFLTISEEEMVTSKLTHYPQYLNQTQQQKKAEGIRKLKYLGGYSFQEQQVILKDIVLFTPQELFLNAKQALTDGNVNCVVRMSILNSMRGVISQTVAVRNVEGKIIKVDLTKLTKLEETDAFNLLQKKILNSKTISEGLKLHKLSEAKLKLFLIYPEINKYQPDLLIQMLLKEKNPLSVKYQKLMREIDTELNKIDVLKFY